MDTISIALDRAKMIKVPEGTQTMIVGNPLIADVTLLKGNGSMVLTGRSFGSTNLILLDAAGTPIAESLVEVTFAPGVLTIAAWYRAGILFLHAPMRTVGGVGRRQQVHERNDRQRPLAHRGCHTGRQIARCRTYARFAGNIVKVSPNFVAAGNGRSSISCDDAVWQPDEVTRR